jgi:hypothetical protein
VRTRPRDVILDPALGITRETLIPRMRERNAASYAVTPHGINLPSGLNMTEELVGVVCERLLDAIAKGSA